MTHANDNFYIEDANHNKVRLPDGWQNYKRVSMTRYGPIGSTGDGYFDWLDPRIAEWRA